jgi:hypothetical protein
VTLQQPKVEKLIAESGPGPYNQNKYKQLCEAFYMVRRALCVLLVFFLCATVRAGSAAIGVPVLCC